MLENTAIYSLSANKELAEKIAGHLGLPLSEAIITKFASGEIIVEPKDTVRDQDVYIIQSTCAPVHENLFELLIFIDALHRSSAKEINIIMPYYGYARQDRKSKPRQPITARLIADLLKVAGTDRVVTVDLHAPQIQGFFSCLVDELTAIPLFAYYIQKKKNLDKKNIVVVSPDHGGANRARKLAEILNTPLAIIDKRRTGVNEAVVLNIIGDIVGKDCIMLDDMIDTAGSCIAGATALKNGGAKSIRICATHAVFSSPADERLKETDFDEILVTDSIPLSTEMKEYKNIQVVSLAKMLAEAIKKIQLGQALSVVYDMFYNC